MTDRVTLTIAERVPFASGAAFGDAGPYELLIGRAAFAVDPREKALQEITDLDKAPVDGDGLVRFATDVTILKPLDLARGNRRLFFDYGNRGNKRALVFFNDAPPGNDPRSLASAGNGFLMRRGYTIVWGGWQGDVLAGEGRTLLYLPVAMANGMPVSGEVRVEFTGRDGARTFPLSAWIANRSHPTVSLDPRHARLTRRRYPDDERIPVPPEAWSFAREEGGTALDTMGEARAVVPSVTHIYMAGGFRPGWIYELIYEGEAPLVLGLGHVAVRELVSFLRHDRSKRNPLAVPGVPVEKAYCFGRSQTGRAIRDFLYRGFNADAEGRRVFDGALPHVAGAGRLFMGRFGNLTAPPGQQYEDHFGPSDRFPFAYAVSTDHLTGKRDGILKRAETDPLVLHSQTATEYWQRRGSLVHTDSQGNDLPEPENVRFYLWSSSQHSADPNVRKPERGVCHNPFNIVATSMLFRAMLDALDRWATDGTKPPASRMPRRADGTLATYEEWRRQFPAIPGVAVPSSVCKLDVLDCGPDAEHGVLREPPVPVAGEGYVVQVPAVDADGNEIAGIRAPMVAAPLATYAGWNLRGKGHGSGAMHEFTGSTIPFADTPEERAMTGDPRRSILDRYPDKAAYVAAIRRAAGELVAERLMLEEDVERCAVEAADWGRPRHDVGLE